MPENKHDLSISMARANVVMLFSSIPVFIVQFAAFILSQDVGNIGLTFNPVLLAIVVILGIEAANCGIDFTNREQLWRIAFS